MSSAPELEELRASFREVLSEACAPSDVRRAHDAGEPGGAALWERMRELGWFSLPVEDAHGGLGLGRRELAILYEELGRCVAPAPCVGVFVAAQAIAASGDAALQCDWLPPLARGEARVALDARWPVEGGGVSLSGKGASGEIALTVQDQADACLAFSGPHAGGVRLAWIAADAPGVGIRSVAGLDLTRRLGAWSLKNVSASVIDLSVREWNALCAHAWLALACDSLGGAESILDRTVAYMQTREQFDRPIGSFQALKHRAAAWKVLLEASRALVRSAVEQWASDRKDMAAAASAAKFYACDAYAAIAGDAVQLHGGIGFTWEHECHLYLKRAKLNQVLFGGSAAHKDRIAAVRFGQAVA